MKNSVLLFWKKTIQPWKGVKQENKKEKAVLFSLISVSLLFILPLGYLLSFDPLQKNILALLFPVCLFTFFLNKTRYYKFSAYVLLLALFFPPFVIIIHNQITNPFILIGWLSWTLLSLILSSVLTDFFFTLGVWAGSLLVSLSLPLFISELGFAATLNAMQNIFLLGLIILLKSYIRKKDQQRIEKQNLLLKKEIISHKETLQTLKDSETRNTLSHMFARIDTFELNISSQELFFPEQFKEILGKEFDTSEMFLRDYYTFFHSQDIDLFKKSLDACIHSQQPLNVTYRISSPATNNIIWLNMAGDIVRDENNTPLYLLGVIQDITEKKIFEKDLLDARIEAERANQAKSIFISNMSHELRTPLNAILGFSQLMEMELDPQSENKSMLNEIHKAGSHLLDLINDILDLSKIEAGKVSISLKSIDPVQAIESAINMTNNLAFQNKITIYNKADNHSLKIMTDPVRLKQILVNFISNGIKYNNPGGKVEISTEASDHLFKIIIKDNGLGIKQEMQKDLFQPFNRLGRESGGIEGTGIGLALTKKLAELMNGKIGFNSSPGNGSTFWVEMTIDRKQKEANRQPDNNNLPGNGAIFCIDDNITNIKLLKDALCINPEISLSVFTSRAEGLAAAIATPPDLVIIGISDSAGLDTLSQLGQNAATTNIPVIALSANLSKEEIATELVTHFFPLPLDLHEFMRTVKTELQQQKTRSSW